MTFCVNIINEMFLVVVAVFGLGQGCGLFTAGSNGFWIDLPEQTVDFDLDIGSVQISSLQPQAQQTVTIELPAKQVDLSSEPKLKEYADSEKIKAVKIKYLRYNLATNSSTIDLPLIDIFLDNYEVTTISTSSIKVAQLPSIKAGQTGDGDLEFVQGGKEAMSNFLLGLKFTVLGTTAITIDTVVVPSGELKGTLLIGLQFQVDPL